MTTTDTLPRDYLAQAKALRAKFFPAKAPVIATREQPRIVEITRPTYESIRPIGVAMKHGKYGPFPLAPVFQAYVEPVSEKPSPNDIIASVARKHGVSVAVMKSDHRLKQFVDARQEAMARIYRERPDISMVSIGKLLGGRDHTTVLAALKKLKVWRGAAAVEAQP